MEIQAVGNEGRILATAGVLESPGVMVLSEDFHAGRQDQCGSHWLPLWDPEQESEAGWGRGHGSCVLKERWNQLRDRKPWSHLGDGLRNIREPLELQRGFEDWPLGLQADGVQGVGEWDRRGQSTRGQL